MIILDATTKSLEILLSGAVTSNQLPFVAAYADLSQSTFAILSAAEVDGATNSTTPVTLVSAPATSTSRKISTIFITNTDTVSATVTVQLNNNGTTRILFKSVLSTLDQATYSDSSGWTVLDSNGNVKSALGGILPASSFPALTGDITTPGGSLVTTLASTGVSAASYGSSTAIPTFTVDAKGRLTTASTAAVVAPAGTITGTTLASNVITSSLTAVGTIVTGTWTATPITPSYGGTGLNTLTAHGVLIGAGTSNVSVTGTGNAGEVLTSNGASSDPTFQASAGGGAGDANVMGFISMCS